MFKRFTEWLNDKAALLEGPMTAMRGRSGYAPIPEMPAGGWSREQIKGMEDEIAKLDMGGHSDYGGKSLQRVQDLYKALYQGKSAAAAPQQPAPQPVAAPQQPKPQAVMGSPENPANPNSVPPKFTGWVKTGNRRSENGLEYYKDGAPANGWTDLPPEHRGQAMNHLATTNFNQGTEIDF